MRSPKSPGGNSAFLNIRDEYSHILDPNERRRLALAEIDKVDFGWNHVRAIMVAGIGFLTDAYDLFTINFVSQMLGLVYWQSRRGIMPPHVETAIKVAAPVGTILGQIGFGFAADRWGRRKIYGLELVIIIAMTIAQALSGRSRAINIVGVTIFWRIMLGIGIGGDYALSAVITAEFATTKWRGAMTASVFAMQGFGQIAAALVSLIATTAFRNPLRLALTSGACSGTCLVAVDKIWRVVIGLGAVPGCLALYYRITIPETPRYTFDIAKDIYKAEQDISAYLAGKSRGFSDNVLRFEIMREHASQLQAPRGSWSDFIGHFGQWKNGKLLLGTAGSWFFLDIAFYGLGLNNTTIVSIIGLDGRHDVYSQLRNSAVGSLIITCGGSLPGYIATVIFVDVLGRKRLQMLGFCMLCCLFIVLGFASHSLSKHAFLGLYIIAQFFFNFGPNATTFIYPSECFPTRYRATGDGLSAAAGKLGAIVALSFDALRRRGAPANCVGTDCSPQFHRVIQIFALFMLCGAVTTFWLLPETSRRSLEEINGEQELEQQQYQQRLRGPQTVSERSESIPSLRQTNGGATGSMAASPPSEMTDVRSLPFFADRKRI